MSADDDHRITEDGQLRVTEDGTPRVIEGGLLVDTMQLVADSFAPVLRVHPGGQAHLITDVLIKASDGTEMRLTLTVNGQLVKKLV